MEKENLENRAEEALVYAYLSTASLVVCFSVALIMLWVALGCWGGFWSSCTHVHAHPGDYM